MGGARVQSDNDTNRGGEGGVKFLKKADVIYVLLLLPKRGRGRECGTVREWMDDGDLGFLPPSNMLLVWDFTLSRNTSLL